MADVLIETLSGQERSRFMPTVTLGLAKDYANLSSWLTENLVPGKLETEFRQAETQCFDSNNGKFANADMGKYFKRGMRSLITDPVPVSVRDTSGKGLSALKY